MPKKQAIGKSKNQQKGEKAVSVKKKTSLTANVYNTEGKTVGKTSLPTAIFAAEINPHLMTQAIRVYLANQRLGTHSAKTRAQVSGSTRKIYRQKGTGRARHGDIKAPIFVGGGIAHGPRPRSYSLKMPVKMKRLALFSALTEKLQAGDIRVISSLKDVLPKTKNIITILSKLNLIKKQTKKQPKILLVLPSKNTNVYLAGRNLEFVSTCLAQLVNTYEILRHENILFTKDAIKAIEETYLGKIASDDHKKTQKKTNISISKKTEEKKAKTKRKSTKKI